MSVKKYTLLFLVLISFTLAPFLPVFTYRAQADSLPGAIAKIVGASVLPHVPTGDTVGDLIESVLKIAMKAVAQATIAAMIKSTITWANTGFQGGPTYVTNLKSFTSNTANGLAASFISGGKLGFLCAPFQNDIRISLANNYYTSPGQYNQCTFTGIANNVRGFIDNFDQGGWNSFIQLTQNPANNPYAAYIQANVVLSGQIAQALNLKNQEYQINDGFLSTRDCLAKNPDQGTIDSIENRQIPESKVDYVTEDTADQAEVDRANQQQLILYDPSVLAGNCIVFGPVKTPGKMIADKIDTTTNSGLDQLINAKDIDDLISALMGGLITRYIAGPRGLFSKDFANGLPTDEGGTSGAGFGQGGQTQITCSATPDKATLGDSVTWSVTNLGFGLGTTTTTYIWSGDDATGDNLVGRSAVSATSTQVTVKYLAASPGTKTASVRVTALDDNNQPQIIDAVCSNSVAVSRYKPLSVSCSPANGIAQANLNQPVTWIAKIAGGSGVYTQIQWDGSQQVVPKTNGLGNRMYPRNIPDYTIPAISQPYSLSQLSGAINPVPVPLSTALNGDPNGQSFQIYSKDPTTGVVTSTLRRVYLGDAKPLGNMSATIQVRDEDPTIPVVTQQCTQTVFINDF